MNARSLLSLGIVSTMAVLSSVIACSGPEKGEIERKPTLAGPSSFRINGVGLVFERRCGSLDCHGSVARNMRIYSKNGLRLPNDAGLKVGQGETSLDESTANYHSILSVEPEQTNAVIAGADPHTLLIVKKPISDTGGGEKHKGGPAIKRGDDAERCIVSWLKEDPINAPIDKKACSDAALFPKE